MQLATNPTFKARFALNIDSAGVTLLPVDGIALELLALPEGKVSKGAPRYITDTETGKQVFRSDTRLAEGCLAWLGKKVSAWNRDRDKQIWCWPSQCQIHIQSSTGYRLSSGWNRSGFRISWPAPAEPTDEPTLDDDIAHEEAMQNFRETGQF